VYSPEFGRLLHLRIVGQNSIIISLPGPTTRNTELALQVLYSGRIEPQSLDREAITLQDKEQFVLQAEPRYVYSNRSYWYPQSTVADYATARLEITVPVEYDAVASGTPAGPPTPDHTPGERTQVVRLQFPETSALSRMRDQPFQPRRDRPRLPLTDARRATISGAEGPAHGPLEGGDGQFPLSLVVQANPRQASGARMNERSAAISSSTRRSSGTSVSIRARLIRSELPGDHSPAISPSSISRSRRAGVWRNDPVSSTAIRRSSLELGINGEAIGWKNYRAMAQQGIAQLSPRCAEKNGATTFVDVLVRCAAGDRGARRVRSPGYKLGHVKSDSAFSAPSSTAARW
jgi:hypothetical protein